MNLRTNNKKLPKREKEPKLEPRKKKISGGYSTKTSRVLLEETRSGITTSAKTSKRVTGKEKKRFLKGS